MAESKKDDLKIVNRAKERIASWYKAWSHNNDYYKEFNSFVLLSKQWNDDEEDALDSRHKQPIVMNMLLSLMNNIVGEQRQNTPDLQVIAITDDVKDKDVEIRQKYVKTICYKSDSKIAYQNAFECILSGGYGVFKVFNDYESELTFNQTIKIEPVYNPLRCFFDPAAKTYTKHDGEFQGMYTSMSKERFKRKYKNVNVPEECELGETGIRWVAENEIMIVDYLERTEEPVTIVQLDNGQVVKEDEYYQIIEDAEMQGIPAPQILSERKTNKTVWTRYKIAGDTILERTKIPGKYPSYIFGACRLVVDSETGKQITQSFFHTGRDAQKLLNYTATQTAYLMKTQRTDQWLATDENVEGHEHIWADVELKHGRIPWNPHEAGGMIIKPERVTPDGISPELFAQYDRSKQDIYTTVGVYETQTGQQGNEVSGAAIDARTQRGNTNTFSVFSNLDRMIAQCGNVIASMMPEIMPNEQTIYVDDEDAGRVPITVNKRSMYGNQVENDLSKGEYLITIQPAGTFDNQKKEILASYELLMKYIPGAATLIADKVAQNLPVPASNDLKKRLELSLDPRVIQMEGIQVPPAPPAPPNPAIMMKMQEIQSKQKNDQAKTQLQAAKVQSDMAKTHSDIVLQHQKAQSDQKLAETNQETEVMRAVAEILNAALSHDNPMAMQMAQKILSNHL